MRKLKSLYWWLGVLKGLIDQEWEHVRAVAEQQPTAFCSSPALASSHRSIGLVRVSGYREVSRAEIWSTSCPFNVIIPKWSQQLWKLDIRGRTYPFITLWWYYGQRTLGVKGCLSIKYPGKELALWLQPGIFKACGSVTSGQQHY